MLKSFLGTRVPLLLWTHALRIWELFVGFWVLFLWKVIWFSRWTVPPVEWLKEETSVSVPDQFTQWFFVLWDERMGSLSKDYNFISKLLSNVTRVLNFAGAIAALSLNTMGFFWIWVIVAVAAILSLWFVLDGDVNLGHQVPFKNQRSNILTRDGGWSQRWCNFLLSGESSAQMVVNSVITPPNSHWYWL